MVDLYTYVTCGMCTLECIQVNVLGVGKSLGCLAGADAQGCGSNLGDCAQTCAEVHLVTLEHELKVRSKRFGIKCRHEYAAGSIGGVSDHVVWTLTEE